jgi:hypothetical protein
MPGVSSDEIRPGCGTGWPATRVEVVALVVGQSQGASQGGEDTSRGVVGAALLEAGEVVD